MILDAERIAKLCEANGITTLRVFGSVARGEDREDSDVDLLVRFADRKTLLDLVRVEEEFERALGRKVDLMTEGGLHPRLKDRVLRDARVLYERAG
jgi:uncharacterized protein